MPMYPFECDKCKKEFTVWCEFRNLKDHPPCEHCKSKKTKRSWNQSNIMIRSTYEQNGRKAICVDVGNGKRIYRSMTKENYLNKGTTGSVYTKGYQEHINKNKGGSDHET